MSDVMKMDVEGLEKLQAKIEQIVRGLRGNKLVQAIKTGTLLVQRDAKINATTYPRVQTGRLRASITPAVRRSGAEVRGVVGSKVDYAPYQEFGTRFFAARRYLRRAVDANRDDIIRLINQAIEDMIEE